MSSDAHVQFSLCPGVQIDAFDSSTRARTHRVELSDGRQFQVNENLFHLLDCLRTPMSLPTLAAEFHSRSGLTVSLVELERLGEGLRAQGIIVQAGQTPSTGNLAGKRADSYLALHYRRDLLSAEKLAPLARLLRVFFRRSVALIALAVVAATHTLAYRQMGFPPHVDMKAVSWPLFYGVIFASVLLHELGHLAACQRWGCAHGPLGIGLYFFQPVFYVDVTAAWRLNRRQRAIVDVGGVYLQLLCVPLFWTLYQVSHEPTYLFAILATDMLILSNFEPFMKLDGYWLLSDLAGVPNLHARTGELMRRTWAWLLRRVGRDAAVAPISSFGEWSPKVRWVVLSYFALSLVIWPLTLLAMIPVLVSAAVSYPTLWMSAYTSLVDAIQTQDVGLLLDQVKTLFLPTLVLVNMAYLVKLASKRRPRTA